MLLNIAALTVVAQLVAAEEYEIIGSYIFGRHNDRESKPATVLTSIGAQNQFRIGEFYRERYFGIDSTGTRDDSSETVIEGLNDEGVFVSGQIYAEAIASNVILFSHYSFLQGLYPPTSVTDTATVDSLMSELANGTIVQNPLNGYQYVNSNIQENATEGYIWTKGDVNCPSLSAALDATMISDLWKKYTNESSEFLQSLYSHDFIKETFDQSDLTFYNAMNIYDEVNVNIIHNATVAEEFDDVAFGQIKYWADLYQWTLSDKSINKDLTIGAQTLVGSILNKLNTTRTSGKPFLNYFTGSFNTMYQLGSVLDLNTADQRFTMMPNYGATYVFELLSDSNKEIFVRFSFQNGTSELSNGLTTYSLFNTTDDMMSWDEFARKMTAAGISKVSTWCRTCGYVDASDLDMCVPYTNLYESAVKLNAEGVDLATVSDSKLSLAGAGGIGAGVTIGVFLILGWLIYLFIRGSQKKEPVLPLTKEVASSNNSERSTLVSN